MRISIRRVGACLAAAVVASAFALTSGTVAGSAAAAGDDDYAGYLFTYFKGEGSADGEQVYFALSRGNDPVRYDDLNGGRPVLTSDVGEQGVRDPFIIRHPETGRFYQIATIDAGHSVIDATVAQDGDTYYRFTKDERSNDGSAPCGKFIFSDRSGSLTSRSWNAITDCIGSGELGAAEGPLIFKSNTEDRWYLFLDEFGGQGYVPFTSTSPNSTNWTRVASYDMPTSPRHGTVVPVTQAEYDALQAAYGTGSGDVNPNRWYWVESAHSGLAWDIAGQSTDTGATLVQGDYSGGEHQHFRFADAGGGYHGIEARHSGLVLDVSGASTANGADIIQWNDHGGSNQQWSVRDNGDGTVTIPNRNSGKALDLYDWATDPGARISQYTDNGNAVQKWILHEAD